MKFIAFVFLMGCVSAPVVELPQQLPASPPSRPAKVAVAIPQPHALTDKEREDLMKEIENTYILAAAYTQFMYTVPIFWTLKMNAGELWGRMQISTTLEEFRFYRDLFEKYIDIVNESHNYIQKITKQVSDLDQKMNDGPPP